MELSSPKIINFLKNAFSYASLTSRKKAYTCLKMTKTKDEKQIIS